MKKSELRQIIREEVRRLSEAKYNDVWVILQWETEGSDGSRMKVVKTLDAAMKSMRFNQVSNINAVPSHMRVRQRNLPAVYWKGGDLEQPEYDKLTKLADKINAMHKDGRVIIQFK